MVSRLGAVALKHCSILRLYIFSGFLLVSVRSHTLHTSKVMLKILQARLQQYVNCEHPDIQAGFRKDRGNRSNCQHPLNQRKQGNSRKTFTSASVDVRLSL